MQQLTFQLTAGQTKVFDSAGCYFEIIDSTGTVNVNFTDSHGSRTKDGELLAVLSGTYLRQKYSRWEITDVSGATNQVTIFYGFGDGGTRRAPGIVSVVDGGKSRTLAGQAFIGYMGNTVGANNIEVQIFNPSATKRLVIKRLTLTCSIAVLAQLARHNAVLTGGGPFDVYNKLIAAPAAMTARLYRDNPVAIIGSGFESIQLSANAPFVKVLEEPLVIPNGESVCIYFATAGAATATGTFEGFEENLV